MSEPRATDFYRPELAIGTVVGNTNQPVEGQTDNRMLVDFVPSDSHAFGYQIPQVLPPGLARRMRTGMFAVASYALGYPQLGYVLGHAFNNDQHPTYADPWPLTLMPDVGDIIPNVDDLAFYHDETGGFWRFRSASGASQKTAGPLGGPGIAELRMRSGVVLAFEEYPLDGAAPPPPQPPGPNPPKPLEPPARAKMTITMPAGTQVLYDEPEVGKATLLVTMPNDAGATVLTIAQDGSITLDATGTVTVNAPSQTVQVDVQPGAGADALDVGVPGMVALGDLQENLPANKGAINNDILTTFGGNINAANLQTLVNHCNAMIAAGIPNANALLPLIVASLIHNVTVPDGSAVVRIAGTSP